METNCLIWWNFFLCLQWMIGGAAAHLLLFPFFSFSLFENERDEERESRRELGRTKGMNERAAEWDWFLVGYERSKPPRQPAKKRDQPAAIGFISCGVKWNSFPFPFAFLLPAAVMGCTAAMGSAKERQAKGEKEMEGIDLLLFLYGRNEIKSYLIEWNPIKNGRRWDESQSIKFISSSAARARSRKRKRI